MRASQAGRQLRVAIEGFDGSGKTTLVQGLIAHGREIGVACQAIGRKGISATPYIAEITENILRWDAGEVTVGTDENARARLRRASARIELADASRVKFLLFDRWLPSDLSRLSADAQKTYVEAFTTLHREAAIDLTVYLAADFEVLWERIAARPEEECSPSELLGFEHMQELYLRYTKVWSTIWNERRLQIDATNSAEMVLGSVLLAISAITDGECAE